MRILLSRRAGAALLALVSPLVFACARATPAAPPSPATSFVFPAAGWDSIADPRTVGWSPAGLDSVRARLATLPSTGFMAVVGGRVLMSYGDVDTATYIASIRKSVLSMIMGNYVRRGTIDLERTLAELGMDDIGGLSAEEKQATVKDLLTARSGVFHEASNGGDDLASAPPRGSQRHGTYYLYSNWDFNALGAAFEQMTGRNIYDALESDIARPIGMQDFVRQLQVKTGDTLRSRYRAYHMWFSTRDMARLGYLMLRDGKWNGREVIPADWVRESTQPFTRVSEMNPAWRRNGPFGYGYLWWVWDGPHAAGPYAGAFTGLGAVGQHISVLPRLDLVVAHKTAPGQTDASNNPRTVSHPVYLEMLDLLVRSHCGKQC